MCGFVENMFKKNKKAPVQPPPRQYDDHQNQNNNGYPPKTTPSLNQLQFHCQLAHGSPMAFVSDFRNVRELYAKIANEFNMNPSEILFCTLNTYKSDMSKLLGGQLGLDDFIFVHQRGRAKEIELTKTQESLGLTITDNGNGYAFIKRIKEGSVIGGIKAISVGDHIEKLDGESMVGKKHFEVAKRLKDIDLGTTFTIRLVEPKSSGFNSIAQKSSGGGGQKKFGSGKETIRFKANGDAVVEVQSQEQDKCIQEINVILDKYMGINDTELATQIYEKSLNKLNSMEFAEAIDGSDLEEFGFNDDLIIEMWGVITDIRAGRR